MRTIWEGRLTGEFHGYHGGRVHELSDGTRWHQECRTNEPVYREHPKAKLLLVGLSRRRLMTML